MNIIRTNGWPIAIACLGLAGASCATDDSNRTEVNATNQWAINSTPVLNDFAVYAQNSIALRDRVKVIGADVGVKNVSTGPTLVTGFELALSTDVNVDTTQDVLANRLQLLARATVGDIEAKTLSNSGGHYAHLYAFPTMPALPTISPVTPGSVNVTAPGSRVTALNAGSYAGVIVRSNGTLRLNGGLYQVASVHLENDAKIEASAPVQLRISGRLSLLDRTRIGAATGSPLSAGDIQIEVSGRNGASGSLTDSPKAVALGNTVAITGLLSAPNGTLQVGQRDAIMGALSARDIYVDNDSVITFQSGLGPVNCSPPTCDDANPCTVDACDNGTCAHTPAMAGTSCSDGNACNGNETCNASGTCGAGTPPSVDDGNPCTIDSCVPASGVQHTPAAAGTSCADTNACNGAEQCNASGVCVAGTPVTCTPLDACHTAGTCDSSTGICSNPAIPNCTLSCPTGFDNCDTSNSDCETNLTNSASNCGSCGTVCPSIGGTAICQNQLCVTSHVATAVNQQSVFNPGATTVVPAAATVQFTVTTPPALGTGAADVHYYLSRNLVFQTATAGSDAGPICQPVAFDQPLPNGVQGNAQSLRCQWSSGSNPLVITAQVNGTLTPRDDPYAAVACFDPFTVCVPVRIALQLPAGTVPTTGLQRTAVILASAPDAPAHPYAAAGLASTFFSSSNPGSARNYYLQASYGPTAMGATTIVGATGNEGTANDVYGPFSVTSNGCMYTSDVIAAIGSAVDFTNYDRLVVAANDPNKCGGGGLSAPVTVPVQGATKTITSSIIYNGAVGDTAVNGRIDSTVLHEYGHQFGLDHGGAWSCGPNTVAYDGSCNDINYLDYTDLMGVGRYADFNPVYKERLGWLEGGRVFPVWSSGRYVINTYEDSSENVKVLQLPRKWRQTGANDAAGRTSGSYYLTLRQPQAPWTDWITEAPLYQDSIVIHMDEGAMNSSTALIDPRPNSPSDEYYEFTNAMLKAGDTFSDPVSGVAVTVVSISGSSATVDVTLTSRATRFVGAGNADPYSYPVDGASVSGVGSFALGTTANLTAAPPSGYVFKYWLDTAGTWLGTDNPYSFAVNADTWVWAVFASAPPANDNFAAAQTVTSLPTSMSGYTQSATTEAGEPSNYVCTNGVTVQPGCTVWYKFTPTTNQNVLITPTNGTTYGTIISVFTGSTLGALTQVPGACNYFSAQSQTPSVTFAATAGTPYYVQVGALGVGQDLALDFSVAP